MANWIKTPNSWQAHCYNCKHAQYTENFKMDYNRNVNPDGYRHSSKSGWTEWPIGECALHGEYAFNVLNCADYEDRMGYEHWSLHPKYRS